MAEHAKSISTYADIAALAPGVRGELINGSLYTHPRPSPRHSTVSMALGMELGGPFQKGSGGPGGWIFMFEPEVKFGEDLLVPDIVGWRTSRLTTLPKTNWMQLRPDWVCEASSPSTALRDRHFKREIYGRAGVPHYWIIDPRAKILEVFELIDQKWTLFGTYTSGNDISAPPFHSYTFPMDALWPLSEPDGFSEDLSE